MIGKAALVFIVPSKGEHFKSFLFELSPTLPYIRGLLTSTGSEALEYFKGACFQRAWLLGNRKLVLLLFYRDSLTCC